MVDQTVSVESAVRSLVGAISAGFQNEPANRVDSEAQKVHMLLTDLSSPNSVREAGQQAAQVVEVLHACTVKLESLAAHAVRQF